MLKLWKSKSFYLESIKIDALAKRASLLRNLSCVVIPTDLNSLLTVMGNVNLHLKLQFSDGVRWIARIKRQNVTTPLKPVQKLVIESEVATYPFLQSTQVPAPRVFDFCASSDNTVGVPYILMEKVPGRPFSKCAPTVEQRNRVMKQTALFYNELYRHPFKTMGSLHLQDSEPGYFIGPLTSELLSDSSDNIESLKTLGPFQDAAHYYDQIIARILYMITDGVLYTP
ncbi:bd1657ca-8f3e-4fc2-a000-08e7acd9b5d7-CDS [Sclerotinia trifoliorum]|uniref:Bd1657ca-8f3e-4fc2-a000-08e7acd9b5d7-CDS n=1 Tax=Sclerotinia trifoliorum TaxID=28548 RepID=A0A8H2ZM06_9HELO|nr:bd1657ca-8f3e-4fc2-a000-08e7acd9b5d7-CDS [Sclerotinia trifoliorum]